MWSIQDRPVQKPACPWLYKDINPVKTRMALLLKIAGTGQQCHA